MADDIEMGDEATASASPRSSRAGSRSPRPPITNGNAVAPSSPSAPPLRRPGAPPSPKWHQSHVAHHHPYDIPVSPAVSLTAPTPAPSPAQLPSSRELGRGLRSVSLGTDTRSRPPRQKKRTASTPRPIGLGLRSVNLDILDSRMEEDEEPSSSDDDTRRRRTPHGSASSNSIATTPSTPLSPISGRSDTDSLDESLVLPAAVGGSSSSSSLESRASSLSASMSTSNGSGGSIRMSTASSSIPSTTPITPSYPAYEHATSRPATSNNAPHADTELCSDPDCMDCVPYNLTTALEREVALRRQLELELEKERKAREETEARAATLLDEAEKHKRLAHKFHTHCEHMSHKIFGERGYTDNMSDQLLNQIQEFQEEISRHRRALGLPPMGHNYASRYAPQLEAAIEAYARTNGRPRSPVGGSSAAYGWGAPAGPPPQGWGTSSGAAARLARAESERGGGSREAASAKTAPPEAETEGRPEEGSSEAPREGRAPSASLESDTKA